MKQNKLPTTELEKEMRVLLGNPAATNDDVMKLLRRYVTENYPFIQ